MKRIFWICVLPALMVAAQSCKHRGATVRAAGETDSISYVIGMNIGRSLMDMDSQINPDAVCEAIRDVFASREKMTMEDAKIYFLRYTTYDKYERMKRYEEQFLEDLSKADRSFVRSASGLTYKVIEPGDQQDLVQSDRDTVVLRRRISRAGETEPFRTDTMRIAVRELVSGLKESVRIIGPGGQMQAWLPSAIGYGSEGDAEAGIEPDALLCYDLNLLERIPVARRKK